MESGTKIARERERKRDGYLTSGGHAKAERERERGRRCEGEREQPFKKEERRGEGGGKGSAQSKRGAQSTGRGREEAAAKKSWKEGDDGEDRVSERAEEARCSGQAVDGGREYAEELGSTGE